MHGAGPEGDALVIKDATECSTLLVGIGGMAILSVDCQEDIIYNYTV
jgi:hypothetical protein